MKTQLQHFSQYDEDIFLSNAFNLNFQGTFLDIGAADGIENSNTYALEKIGWNGLCIEPDPRHIQTLAHNRKNILNAAIRAYEGFTKFHLSPNPTWSSVSNKQPSDVTITILCTTVNDILRSVLPLHVNILSVDTEGLELEILQSVDWSKHRPDIVIAEYDTVFRPSAKQPLTDLMLSLNYATIHTTQGNLIFRSSDCMLQSTL